MLKDNKLSDEALDDISGGGRLLDAGAKLLKNKKSRRLFNIKSALFSEQIEKTAEKLKDSKKH